MATNKGNVHIEVMKRLRGNPTLAAYIKNIHDFNRDVVLSADMPCIVVSAMGADEEYADFPKRKQDFLVLEIRGILYVKDRIEYKKDVMFEDPTSNFIGLYKLEADIKNALEMKPDGTTDDLSYDNTAHFPKIRTAGYDNIGQNVSAHVVIEIVCDCRYFFVGQR